MEIRPLSAANFADWETLLGEACGGCWCMASRLHREAFDGGTGEANRRAFRALVDAGRTPGLLAYDDGAPVGWISVEPREAFPALDVSPTAARVDDRPVWSITCLYVRPDRRRGGLSSRLVAAACDHARRNGATCVESYPVVPEGGPIADDAAWVGPRATYAKSGFVEVARRSPTRAVMRFEV